MCAASRHVFRSAPVPPWPWNRRAVEDDWHWFAVECLHFYNLDHSWTLQLSMAESFCMETLTADTFSKTDLTKHVNPLGNTPVWCDTDASVNKKVTDQMAPQLTPLVYLLSTTSNRFGFKHNFRNLYTPFYSNFVLLISTMTSWFQNKQTKKTGVDQ